MITLKRIWLWIDGYCWPHTTRWCVACVEVRREATLQHYQRNLRRNENMAYEIRQQRAK